MTVVIDAESSENNFDRICVNSCFFQEDVKFPELHMKFYMQRSGNQIYIHSKCNFGIH